MLDAHRQAGSALRLEWGPYGAAAIGRGCGVAVVVDVLSFTTTVTVAADRGIGVLPYRWGADDAARAFAGARGATLAVGRSRARPDEVSLSPRSVRRARDLRRLVLPSPNGSTISAGLAGEVPAVVAMSLRNRRAVAGWLGERRAADRGLSVAVVCAGERWPDGSLRPAVEDLWGAGALVELLAGGGWPDVAPEAIAAAAAFGALDGAVGDGLRACASGRELIDAGHPDDVEIAAELDRSASVPVLRDGMFGPA
ncbi:MAG: 2-phosphosulfolactate phosphatase [Pseudonocardiales bacterium]|nr:2-phosphosulfolactate phosphatase [Pseudonocardiales bacterium]